MVCSDSGPTPSCSVAASTGASTACAADPVRRPRTVIAGAPAPGAPWPSGLGMSRARLDAGGAVVAGFGMAAVIALNRDEAVPDVADGADQGLMLGTELCPEHGDGHDD